MTDYQKEIAYSSLQIYYKNHHIVFSDISRFYPGSNIYYKK